MNKKKRIEFLLHCLQLKKTISPIYNSNKISFKDWRKILKDAENHRVIPLLYYHLKRNNEISVPDEIKARLEGSYLKSSLYNTKLFYEFSKIINELEKENVPVIALKGAYIANKVYPNIALRPMYDLDLLVKSENVAKTHDILTNIGWLCGLNESQYEDCIQQLKEIEYRKSDILLELHLGIIEIKNTDPWENAFPVMIGKNSVFALKHSVLFPYLCIHQCEHLSDLFTEIIRIYDAVQIIRQDRDNIDWDKVIQTAEENQAKSSVYRVLYFVKNELGEDIPEGVLSRLKEDKAEITILQALHKGRKIGEIKPVGHIIKSIQARMFDPSIITIGEIAKLIIGSIFPSKEYMIEKYNPKHASLFFVYYPVRSILGIKNVIKDLFRRKNVI